MPYRGNHLFFILFFSAVFIASCSSPEEKKDSSNIETAFNNWVEKQIDAGEFFGADSCKPEYFVDLDTLPEFAYAALGVPSGSESIEIYEIDLGNDSLPDALILFYPDQCDGGNASRWIQYQLLAISGEDGYFIQDSYFRQFSTEKGFIHFSKAEGEIIYGYYYEFYEDDAPCCPSVKRPLKLNLRTNLMEVVK